MNRGNHEDAAVNVRYGFTTEVQKKYHECDSDGKSPQLINLITDTFRWLPIAIVVDDSVLVVHGGISKEFDLEVLDSIDRSSFPSVLVPPELPEVYDSLLRYFMTMTTEELEAFEKETCQKLPDKIWHWRYLMTLLWSDPQQQNGYRVNKSRGGGGLFGPDVTQHFLNKHKLKVMIRSHQCKEEGYDTMHEGNCLTIFSASNYYDQDSNKGAVMKFEPISDSTDLENLNLAEGDKIVDYTQPKVVQFQVDLNKIKKARNEDLIKDRHIHAMMSLRYKLLGNMAKVISGLRAHELLDPNNAENQSQIEAQLGDTLQKTENSYRARSTSLSSDKTGKMEENIHIVRLSDWNKILLEVIHVEPPWMLIRNDLPMVIQKDPEHGICVKVEETFNSIKARADQDEEVKKAMNSGRQSQQAGGIDDKNGKKSKNTADVLSKQEYYNQAELIKLFEMLDSDNSGSLEKKELVDACASMPMFAGVDIEKLADLMDFNKDGKIELNEFMEAFRLVLTGRA